MKRFIALSLLSLFAAACWPITPDEQENRNKLVGDSFRCMWTGDCAPDK